MSHEDLLRTVCSLIGPKHDNSNDEKNDALKLDERRERKKTISNQHKRKESVCLQGRKRSSAR